MIGIKRIQDRRRISSKDGRFQRDRFSLRMACKGWFLRLRTMRGGAIFSARRQNSSNSIFLFPCALSIVSSNCSPTTGTAATDLVPAKCSSHARFLQVHQLDVPLDFSISNNETFNNTMKNIGHIYFYRIQFFQKIKNSPNKLKRLVKVQSRKATKSKKKKEKSVTKIREIPSYRTCTERNYSNICRNIRF